MKSLNKAETEFICMKAPPEINIDMPPNTLTIATNKISIYDRTLDLTIDLSNIDLNNLKSIIINGVTFTKI